VGGADKNYWNAPWNWGYYGNDIVTAATVHKFFPIVNRAVDALYYFIVSGVCVCVCVCVCVLPRKRASSCHLLTRAAMPYAVRRLGR
jgi:hypothetical protein